MKIITTITERVKKTFTSSGLKARAAKGGLWLGFGSGSENGLRLLRNMILARVLLSDTFGLMAIILAVNGLFESFTQMGVKEAVIQNPKGNEVTFLNGAFWLSFVRGVLLFIVAVLLVPVVAAFYKKPELVPVMRLAFVSILFQGMMSPKAYSELKQMNYLKWVIVFHGGSVVGIVTTIVLGLMFHNIWALVIGFTVENASRCLLSYIVCPYIPRFEFEKESLRTLFSFARGIFGLPILVFLYTRIDIFVLGKYIADSELGMYSLSLSLVQAPYQLYATIINPILLPAFSSIQQNKKELAQKVSKGTMYVAIIFVPLLTVMACASSQILTVAYGEEYAVISLTFMILCATVALRIMSASLVSALFSIGSPQLTRTASITRILSMLIVIVPLVKAYGVMGAAIASLIAGLIFNGIIMYYVSKHIHVTYIRYIKSLIPSILIGALLGLVTLVIVILI